MAVFNEAQRVVKERGIIIVRDNRRVYGSPWWGAFIWLITRFMSRPRRKNWAKVILSSYTIPEVVSLIKKSRLDNCRVGTDFVKFDLVIERLNQ